MDILQIASQIFAQKMGGNLSENLVQTALKTLMDGDLNIADLVSKFSENGALADTLRSWLGDGQNQSISVANIMDVFGGQKVEQFASSLGLNNESAAGGLAEMIPELIDKSSSGGNLLDSVGGIGGALNMAKGLF